MKYYRTCTHFQRMHCFYNHIPPSSYQLPGGIIWSTCLLETARTCARKHKRLLMCCLGLNSLKFAKTFQKHPELRLKCLKLLPVEEIFVHIPFEKIIPFGPLENSPSTANRIQKTSKDTNGIQVIGIQPTKFRMQSPIIAGQLRNHQTFWNSLTIDTNILNIIKDIK